MSIPINKRYEIVFLSIHKLGPKMSNNTIAKIIGCSTKTVRYWLKRYKKNKDLNELNRSGKNRCTSKSEDKKIIQIAEMGKMTNTTLIQKKLKREGMEIKKDTIRRRLKENGGRWCIIKSKKFLENKHREERLKWAYNVRKMDWNKVIFTDETTFFLNKKHYKSWDFPSTKRTIKKTKLPIKVNVWGCFSSKGFGSIYCFTENLTSEKLCEIYSNALIESSQKLFPETNDWILQEDNDPKHRSKIATKWKDENKINVLQWPSYSPDQNPIENVWSILKIKIAYKDIKTIKGLKAEIKKEWNKLSIEYSKKLVDSMDNRISSLIKEEGDYTLY